jgi:hypothetical protein
MMNIMTNNYNSRTGQSLGMQLFYLQIALLPVVIIGIVFAGYKGIQWTELLSFRVDDGWCRTGIEGIGRHCFGDFGLAFNRGTFENVYVPGNLDATSTPLTAVIFEFFRLFSYDVSLTLYQGLMILSVFAPIFWSTSGFSLAIRFGASAILGLGSIGAITAIDRGNHVAIMVPLGLAYIISLEKKKWAQAVLFLTILSMLKFWGIMLIIGLLGHKRYRDSLKVALLTMFGSLGLLMFFPGDFHLKLTSMLASVSDNNYASKVAGYATSTHGLIKRMTCAMTTKDWCNTETHAKSLFSSSIVSLIIVLCLVGWCWWLLRVANAPIQIWGSSVLALTFMGVPDAPIYNTVFIVAIVALIFWSAFQQREDYDYGFKSVQSWRRSSTVLIWVVALTQLPMTIFIAYSGVGASKSVFASGTTDVPPFFRLDYWTSPALWLLFVIVTLFDGRGKVLPAVGKAANE